jgi:ribose transport system substrate-binding protein
MTPWGKKRHWRAFAVIAAAASLCLPLAACSDGSAESSGAASDEVSQEDLARYDERLEALYKGTYKEPTGPAITPPREKNVWAVFYDIGAEGNRAAAEGVQEAGRKLGWKVTVVDGQSDSIRLLQGVEQAVADNADGVIVGYVDCATIRNALQKAKDRGIPTVSIEGYDCEPSVYTHSILYVDDMSYAEFAKQWGGAQAAWVIAKTRGEAKALFNTQTDAQTVVTDFEGAREEFDKCPTCEVLDDVTFVGADMGPKLQQKISQALIKYPEANSFIAAYDAVFTTGGANALRAAGRQDMAVMGGEGSSPMMGQIRDGIVGACVGLPTGYEGYGAVDSLSRIMLGRDAGESNTGIGVQVCDKDHNMPPEGEGFQAPIDYVASYEKLWGLR